MKTKTNTPLFSKIVWVLNIIAMIGLLLSYLASYISPRHIWWLALFGLAYEIFLLLNIIFIVYWAISRRKRFLFSLILALAGIGKIFGIVQFNSPHSEEMAKEKNKPLKVMSFNVRLFDLYNWFHNTETRNNIFNFLEKESPDVVCFQEFFSSDSKKNEFKNTDTLKYFLHSKYSQVEYTLTLRQTDHWGIATFSRFPIVNKQAVHFNAKGGNIFIASDIKVGDDTIRVYNTHLESIRFGWQSYRFIENLNNDDVQQDELAGGITILRQLKKAFVKRATEVEMLHDSMMKSPYPVILCGDFNDTPSSYSYSTLSDHLTDAFKESGRGFGKTYNGPFPSFRIDYIFHDKKFRSFNYQTYHQQLSDHFPVSCLVYLE